MKQNPFVITLSEYQRIFRVIHSIFVAAQGDSPKPSCKFYNAAGAFVLSEVCKVRATVVCGAAFLKIADDPTPLLALGHVDQEAMTWHSDGEGFHCWVETKNHVLDFTAPLYGKYLAPLGEAAPKVTAKMFQKLKGQNSATPWDVQRVGDFHFQPNQAMTRENIIDLAEENGTSDLIKACASWYTRPPKQLSDPPLLYDNQGMVAAVELYRNQILGKW